LTETSHWKYYATVEDYYNILNISIYSTYREIRDAYVALAKVYHPDHVKNKTSPSWKRANEKFAMITRAYRTLSDHEKRREYDRNLRGKVDKGTVLHSKKLFEDAKKSVRYNEWLKAEKIMAGVLKLSKRPEYVAYYDMIEINLGRNINKNFNEIKKIMNDKLFEGIYHAIYARALLALGKIDDAERSAKDALKWDPECAEAMFVLEEIRNSTGSEGENIFSKFRTFFKKK